MSDLSHLDDIVEGQDRGADLVIKHPVSGEPMTDIVLVIAGPDSNVQRRARLKMQDELMVFRGRPPADDYDRMDIDRLARCVVGWRVKRDSKPIAFSFTNVVKLFTDMTFVREQADKFAQSRSPYFMRTAFDEETT